MSGIEDLLTTRTLEERRARPGSGATSAGAGRAGSVTPLPQSMTLAQMQQQLSQALYTQSVQSNAVQSPPRGAAAGAGAIPGLSPEQQALQTEMMANQAPQDRPATVMAPGAPLPPTPGLLQPDRRPRQFNYEPGFNYGVQPRQGELTTYAQLRALAYNYEAVQLCERVWFDVLNRMSVRVTFEMNVIPDGESDLDPKWRKIAEPAEEFLSYPDGERDINDWLCAAFRDVMELGNAYIYKRRNLLGEVMGLDLVDPALMRPLITETGRQPQPPFPAYRQYVWGLPGDEYTKDEVYVLRENSRTESVWPWGRLDAIVYIVNVALRKQALDLTRFTDGSIPEGIIFPGDQSGWTTQDVEEFERMWNGLLAGNQRMLVRMKAGPPGGKFIQTRPDDPMTDFDHFLLNITAASFGVSMDELGFTNTSNRSTGQTQEAMQYRRIIKPLALRVARMLTAIVKDRFDKRLKVEWGGIEEPDDRLLKARELNIGVQNGSLSPSRMAAMMGWPVDVRVSPFVRLGRSVVFLEDANALRRAQLDANLKALQFSYGDPNLTAGLQDTVGAGGTPLPPSVTVAGNGPPGGTPGAGTAAAAAPVAPGAAATGKPISKQGGREGQAPKAASSVRKPAAEGKQDAADANTTHRVVEADVLPSWLPQRAGGTGDAARAARADTDAHGAYQRWHRVALRAATEGRAQPRFMTDQIPLEQYQWVAAQLARAADASAVRAVFATARRRFDDAEGDAPR